ncbi:sigma factor-binding protein Crl [Pantoea sp. Aalb]|uniref:sigma factor-binding protein Crl n=1 Tax=Pantoea sp. Aalb TaxID=2576762 RepID=UPI00132AA1C2|nr:sigma factor-binding protein Crl [Pantoea sp. Aalb]MXP67597.1 sigma factor-binding protein Crl [Pantoea sp. Aalb]
MILSNDHFRSYLLKRLIELGPYLREGKCAESLFFFDCLAACVNVKPKPERREFWGWWMELKTHKDYCTYEYHLGLFNKDGEWNVVDIKGKDNHENVKRTLNNFHERLKDTLQELKLDLKPIKNK